jgi:hypothetical protein
MLRKLPALAAALLGLGLCCYSAYSQSAPQPQSLPQPQGVVQVHHRAQACEPGYKIVEEIVYKDVIKTCCQRVPNEQFKWVYTCVDDPICIKCVDCKHCPTCNLIHRKVLVKKLVPNECADCTKCQPFTFVEKVAVTVCRKVPCDTSVAPPVAAPTAVETIPTKPLPTAK